MKYLIITILLIIFSSCAFHEFYSPYDLKYVEEAGIRRTEFENLSYPDILYVYFSEYFKVRNDLDEKEITVHIRVLDSGKVDSVGVESELNITRTEVNMISKNMDDWMFKPAENKSGTPLLTSFSFNWSAIYSQWKSLLTDLELSDSIRSHPIVISHKTVEILETITPKFNFTMITNRSEGTVLTYVHVDTNGDPDLVMIAESTNEKLNDSVLKSVKQWKFETLIDNKGQETPFWILIPMGFKLG